MNGLFKIEKLDHFGRGITKIDNIPIFVWNSVPGDVVKLKIIKEKKNYMEAIIDDIEKPSPLRLKSPCVYSSKCGGCSLLNISSSNAIKYKEERLKEIINKFSNLNIKINNIVHGQNFNYRNKISLHIEDSKLGLYEFKSKKLINIEECLIVDRKINKLIKRLSNFIKKNNHHLKEIVIRSFKGETLLSFKGLVNEELLIENFSDLTSVWLNDTLIIGKENIKVNFCGYTFQVSKEAFFQVNVEIAEKMFNYILYHIKQKHYKNALDLYCGTGVIGIIISKYIEHIDGIEVVKKAIDNANINKGLNNVKNISFICGKVENHISKFKNTDLIIVDPPRSGLDNKTIQNILTIKPKEIIYVSCDAVTLSRDLKQLNEIYTINEITPFDMFPNTHHVECVSLLSLKTFEK